ncbi:MAG: ORF6N domain-containing protein [Campylobacterota bacterium]|nr:ORF6N domain-containing protein [Campylobacterota bacterium]
MDMINDNIKTKIYNIRDTKVMLDSDLAKLYQVETKVLNQAVKRNIKRFPNDFRFQLSREELENLRSQFVTTNFTMTRTYPYVFTQNGIAMLSSVLKSNISIEVNIQIMRTFTKIREFALEYNDVTKKLKEIEQTIKIDQEQMNYNTERIDEAFHLLNQILRDTKDIDKNLIGFRPNEKT